MTAPGAGWGATEAPEVSEAEVDAAARAHLYPTVLMGEPSPMLRRHMRRILDAALAARPSPQDGGAAGEVERLTRERDEARDDLAEWMKHVAEVNAHAGRMQDRAEAAERELAAWKAHPQHGQRVKAGVRLAIAWLHARGHAMNDPHAKAVLDCAADNLGNAMSRDPTHPVDAVIAAALGEALNGAAALRDRATAAESRAEAAERRLGEAVGVLRRVEWCSPLQERVDFAHRDACPVCRGWDPDRYSDGLGHALDCALAAQLGAAAREGGAVCRDFRQTDDGTNPQSEDGHAD